MVNRLEVINRALVSTGNAPCDVEEDGSDEWTVAASGYERALEWMLGHHPWAFARQVTPALPRAPAAATPKFKHSFILPPDRLLLRAVYWQGHPIGSWGLVNDLLCCDYEGDVTAEIVYRAPEQQWSPAFVEALTTYVEAVLYQGLNEDQSAAKAARNRADALVQDASFQSDTQTPGRAWYASRVARARRGRRC